MAEVVHLFLIFARQAFSNMTEHTRRLLCEVMVFAIVPKEGTIVMKDGEELDSWSVILNGEVEITRPNGIRERLQMGDRSEFECCKLSFLVTSKIFWSPASILCHSVWHFLVRQ